SGSFCRLALKGIVLPRSPWVEWILNACHPKRWKPLNSQDCTLSVKWLMSPANWAGSTSNGHGPPVTRQGNIADGPPNQRSRQLPTLKQKRRMVAASACLNHEV